MTSPSEPAEQRSQGATPSERLLARLAKHSFLSLWSYSNLFTNEGQRSGNGDGKELCDLLVVFGHHVLIFSDKHCEFPDGAQLSLAWSRWYRRAVEKSARQLVGAQSWIRRFPDRVFLDKTCSKPFPLTLPAQSEVRFHLIAVTRGAYRACRAFFSGQSTGSLMINTRVFGNEHRQHPFTVGRVLSQGPFIHVFDELTLNVVLRELDTITDLVEYLERKERLLTHPSRAIMASGEEQLVAMYMTRLNSSGNHDFVDIPDDADGVYIDEGHWEEFIKNPQYRAKKSADEISYAWDRLIEHFTAHGAPSVGTIKLSEPSRLNRHCECLPPNHVSHAGNSQLN